VLARSTNAVEIGDVILRGYRFDVELRPRYPAVDEDDRVWINATYQPAQ
jgi:hypothetical protein